MNKSVFLIAICVTCVFGCKRADPLVGVWTTSVGGSEGTTQTYNADKTFTWVLDFQGLHVEPRGTWSATDKDLTVTVSAVESSADTQQQMPRWKKEFFEALKSEVGAQIGKTTASTYSLSSSDQLDITYLLGAHWALKRKH